MDTTSTKKSEISRAMLTQDVPRDVDVDNSYQHLCAKFIHSHDPTTILADDSAAIEESDEIVIQSHLRRSSERLETTDRSSSLDWDNVLSVAECGGVAELCQYIQKLEAEKRDLLDQVHFHIDQDATQKVQLNHAKGRIDKLEKELQLVMQHGEKQQMTQRSTEAVVQEERQRSTETLVRLESLQCKWEETERARQQAVAQLRELRTPNDPFYHPTYSTSRSITGMGVYGEIDPTTGSSERVERYKREIELLRQKLVLREQQYQEQLKQSIEIALQHTQKEQENQLEKVRVAYQMQLSTWREEEGVRSKRMEAMMEEDRYSIRLEMKHGMISRPSIGYYQTYASSAEGDHTMDEVLVRMQLELLRTRRFAALKTVLNIRESTMEITMRQALGRWKGWTSQVQCIQWNAVLHMNRIARQLRLRQVRQGFQAWQTHTQLLRMDNSHQQAMGCWNRMLAVERLNHVIQQRQIKQVGKAWARWRLGVVVLGSGANGETGDGVVDIELQEEIKKLHDQLASSKSEAWRYKRQLLKQFL